MKRRIAIALVIPLTLILSNISSVAADSVFEDSTSFQGEGTAFIYISIKGTAIEVEEIIQGEGSWEFQSEQMLAEGGPEDGEANYEGVTRIDYEGDGLMMMQRAESVGFHGGIDASVLLVINATVLELDKALELVTTAQVGNWQSLSFQAQAQVEGMLELLAEWDEFLGTKIRVEGIWEGIFDIEKTLSFEELVE